MDVLAIVMVVLFCALGVFFGWLIDIHSLNPDFAQLKEPEMKPLAMYRQGDVLLVKVDAAPKGVNEVKMDRVILAYGEVTGHAHVLEREKVKPLMKHPRPDKAAWDSGAERFIQVLEKTALKHLDLPRGDKPTGEHADIALDPGLYKVVRQREWSDQDERYVND